MRIEKDSLGQLELPDNAVYGIHSLRSSNNFPSSNEQVNPHLIKAYLLVKKAAAVTNKNCNLLDEEKYSLIENAINKLLEEADSAIESDNKSIFEKVIVDPYQGGAGTSLNMNINEIITNTALKLGGKNYGGYDFIHPLDDVNMSQSTNDTFPTALKIAVIYLLRELSEAFALFQRSLQNKEEEFKGIIKLARTQYQDAVPITLGQEFGAYAQAVARDRWRVYNCEERIRSVNLGGTAVGNSITAERKYVLTINANLKKITGLPIAKGEDLIDTTQNQDTLVEVHGLAKAGSVSLQKICNDLRFLSSGPAGGIGEINLPPKQSGSSIMPGKVNPVILENAIQICELIKANDLIITNLSSAGHLELNPFMPMIAHTMLKSLSMLKDVLRNVSKNCIHGITANKEKCKSNLINTSAIAASLIPTLGYDKIEQLVKEAFDKDKKFIDLLFESGLLTEEELYKILSKEIGIEIE
ncbi:MAG: aspartate ammonia-lyase [Melioribacteraceae bacterium]|nr:aspartate ammonia-lyase [Melioribacteraceae bacterium]